MLLQDRTIQTSLKPIERKTADQRLAVFEKNQNSIYNKYSPFTNYGSIGPSQPFIYTKISDSTFLKRLTKYDTLAAPIGSTARDIKRVGQFLVTGNGLLFVTKQLFLQNKNAFNETRIYNPLSVLKATTRPGSLGLIDYPQRHLETSGGLLNFFKDAFLSTIGAQTQDAKKPRIDGTATGVGGVAYSNYVGGRGGARAGMLRFQTANKASAVFESIWVASPNQGSTSGGFLANLGKALIGKLKSLIPSTNPLGAFGGQEKDTWQYRPEYKAQKDGIYYAFLADSSALLKTPQRSVATFYNDEPTIQFNGIVSNYHKYSPQRQERAETRVWYADDNKISTDSVGVSDASGKKNNIKDLYAKMVDSIDSFKNESNQFRRSAERYSQVKDKKGFSYSSYKDIPNTTEPFWSELRKNPGLFRIDKDTGRKFNEAFFYKGIKEGRLGAGDTYNSLEPLPGSRGELPSDLVIDEDINQSRDLLFFYFYDLINEIYVPFRATIKSVSDQHQADWEEVSYIGRADKLFLYKGFSRDVSFSFTVYANSAREMLPMWERINYLVGLTRPSKYTGVSNKPSNYMSEKEKTDAIARANDQLAVAEASGDTANLDEVTQNLERLNKATSFETTGREAKFIYPPMTTFRLGDMYVDQPCIIQSVGVNVSDEANWESLRSDNYFYAYSGKNPMLQEDGVKARQLPLQVDVSVTLKMLEKAISLGSSAHYGKTIYDDDGNETKRWML